MTPEPTPVTGPTTGPASGDPHPAAPHRLRILLLEDNPADARLTQERLRGSAIDCDVATQLREVSQQRLAGIDCALIDLGLPDASGLQALQRIRDLAPELPIVVLTGFADEVTGPLALRLGAQDNQRWPPGSPTTCTNYSTSSNKSAARPSTPNPTRRHHHPPPDHRIDLGAGWPTRTTRTTRSGRTARSPNRRRRRMRGHGASVQRRTSR